MIDNERQYAITKAWVQRFEQVLRELRKTHAETAPEYLPLIVKAQIDGVASIIEELQAELDGYDDKHLPFTE